MNAVDEVLKATYTSSATTAKTLKNLTREAGFTAENILSRVAVARSINAGSLDGEVMPEADGNGKQIRGSTLFGKRELAVAMILLMLEQDSTSDPRHLVRLHWERGLRLLSDDAREHGVLDVLAELLRTALDKDPDRLEWDPARLSSSFVGQAPLVQKLADLVGGGKKRAVLKASAGMGRMRLAQGVAAACDLAVAIVGPAASDTGLAFDAVRDATERAGLSARNEDGFWFVDRCVLVLDLRQADDEQLSEWVKSSELVINEGFTLILARDDEVDSGVPALTFKPYSRDEIADILRVHLGAWPLEVRRLLALAGRLVPQAALSCAAEFKEHLGTLQPKVRPNISSLLSFMEIAWGIDRLGLATNDYEMLQRVKSKDVESLSEEWIRFMEQLGFVEVASSGLVMTPRGNEALNASSKETA